MQLEMQRHRLVEFSVLAELSKYRHRATIKFNCA